MHLPLNHSSNLPKSFPVGATYVVVGRGGEEGNLQVSSRYVVLPSGDRIDVPADIGTPFRSLVAPARRRRVRGKAQNPRKVRVVAGPKKFLRNGGTGR